MDNCKNGNRWTWQSDISYRMESIEGKREERKDAVTNQTSIFYLFAISYIHPFLQERIWKWRGGKEGRKEGIEECMVVVVVVVVVEARKGDGEE